MKVVIQACDAHKLFLNWVIGCPQNLFTPGYLIPPLVIQSVRDSQIIII